MERLKLPEESRRLLVQAGVQFETWLIGKASESGRLLEDISPTDLEQVCANLKMSELQEFLRALIVKNQKDVADLDEPGERQAA
ncbi:hypothetical protein [Thalassoglobus polymorphus]|uniref:Uncharacterized protein n=1 Tax=Thalassoglobus polymorphus TaxID=2527994 RepID=A0A517QRK9_9PLAN|nr:hypothetical protein [Thalassoglobus polymorphus]QDT34257.1 hypothetical protein Mal48_35170 [Thalassoglobus polymorphus]